MTRVDAATLLTPGAKRPARARLAGLFASKVTAAGAVAILGIVVAAATAPRLAPYDPVVQDLSNVDQAPSAAHPLGTDQFGRDVLSRILWGSRVSLVVGVGGSLFAGLTGTVLGAAAGYHGGWTDRLAARVSDLLMAFPTLLLGVMIAAGLGPGVQNVVLAISIALFPRFVRVARASSLSVRAETYIEAAAALGRADGGIIVKHVLPNISGPLIVMGTLWVGTAIRLEASLNFLGLGAQPPSPSWGSMIREGMNNLLGSPWPMLFAGLAIAVCVLAFNMVGDALRDALDPATRD
jgi:peptide/nickel transport system permease protein